MKELRITDDELDILWGALQLQAGCNGVYCISSYEKALNGDEEELAEYEFHGYTLEDITRIISPFLSLRDKVCKLWEQSRKERGLD